MATLRTRWTRTASVVASASLIALAVPALSATTANAATQTITITASGFVPMNLTITSGDTISFTNADTSAHQVLFKATTGFTCTVTPIVVQPTKTQSCTWTASGIYPYSDPNQSGKNFRGTVTVDPAAPVVVPTVSLSVATDVVTYGTQATLTGKVVPATAGTMVEILAQASGESSYTKVASVVSANGGTYTVALTPEIATSYRAEFQKGTVRVVSPVASVTVRPVVGLALRSVKGSVANLFAKITSGMTYEGRFVLIQRRNSLGGWTTLKRAVLGSFSTSRFAVRLPKGTSRIRALLTTAQAGAGYLSSTSPILTLSR